MRSVSLHGGLFELLRKVYPNHLWKQHLFYNTIKSTKQQMVAGVLGVLDKEIISSAKNTTSEQQIE